MSTSSLAIPALIPTIPLLNQLSNEHRHTQLIRWQQYPINYFFNSAINSHNNINATDDELKIWSCCSITMFGELLLLVTSCMAAGCSPWITCTTTLAVTKILQNYSQTIFTRDLYAVHSHILFTYSIWIGTRINNS